MRVWRYQGVHRLTWVLLALLVLAVAVFAMAAGFSQLHSEAAPMGTGEDPVGDLPPPAHHVSAIATPTEVHGIVMGEAGRPVMRG